jgi:hypothetical protein
MEESETPKDGAHSQIEIKAEAEVKEVEVRYCQVFDGSSVPIKIGDTHKN